MTLFLKALKSAALPNIEREKRLLFGTWHAIEKFKLVKVQIATKAEALIIHSNCLSRMSRIIKENIASALDKAQSEGFAPEDIFNDKF